MKVFAIEFTNHCNAKCWFCPHPDKTLHDRERGQMTKETVEKVIKATTADTISINGLGEPLMNPNCIEFIQMFTDAGIRTLLNSNGKMVTQESYDALTKAGLTRLVVASDYFKWEKGKVKENDRLKIDHIVVDSEPQEFQVKKELYDWAGRVGEAKNEKVSCSYLEDNWIQIMWDGQVVRCCQDFNTNEPLGHIDDIDNVKNCSITDCATCQGFRFDDALVIGDYKNEN